MMPASLERIVPIAPEHGYIVITTSGPLLIRLCVALATICQATLPIEYGMAAQRLIYAKWRYRCRLLRKEKADANVACSAAIVDATTQDSGHRV